MNHLGLPLFYLFSATAIASALIVVLNQKPAYSVLALTLTMVALSALFVLLEAYFVAVIQVLIYAGAILVLFLFVIMLLGIEGADRPSGKEKTFFDQIRPVFQMILALLLLTEFGWAITHIAQLPAGITSAVGNVEAIGEMLFTSYLLPFELVSGILLLGIFGVVNLAYQGRKK